MVKNSTQNFSTGSAKTPEVECLGLKFADENARREHFLNLLKAKLVDPLFKTIEGFPAGEDEDILALSDPPYYTACPNPFLADFVEYYQHDVENKLEYVCAPLAVDVSKGKGDYIYSAHSYHTKVPPQAIAQYILHYTSPGDLVLDPFSGSGMTGVASYLCGNRSILDPDNLIENVQWGERIPVLVDLSPAATLIGSVYLNPPEPDRFAETARSLLKAVSSDLMEDWTIQGKKVGYFVKAEVFNCPSCQELIATSEIGKMTDSIGTASEFPCGACGALVTKAQKKNSSATRLERKLVTVFDTALAKAVPNQRVSTIACMTESGDFRYLEKNESKILDAEIAYPKEWFPNNDLIPGDRLLTKDCCKSYGISHVHHFYSRRQLRYYAALWNRSMQESDHALRRGLLFLWQSYSLGATRLNRFIPAKEGKKVPGSQVNRYFTGTLYIPSMVSEVSPRYLYTNKITKLEKAFTALRPSKPRILSTQSATDLTGIPSNSIDYIFVDPPFGENLQYSELNQLWESWLKIFTNREPEAVMDQARKRDVFKYGSLMRQSFSEMNRVLKPGHWMTLAFHNSFNAVWAQIQESLFAAGFVVADVRVLDKQQDTYKQSRQGLPKQDLVISAYKPTDVLEKTFEIEHGTESGVWDFIRSHLKQLPVFVCIPEQAQLIAERQSYLLFDRMIAFHVQRGYAVPISAAEFYAGLKQHFPERDSMFFLSDQVNEYDRKRMDFTDVEQMQLFVSDEKSAIQWIRHQLNEKPMKYSELSPFYMKEAQRVWEKHEQPLELRTILEQNFVEDADGTWRIADLAKESDLEQLRHRALMKEFQKYLDQTGKLKIVRTEALRAGFRESWQKQEYATIVDMAKRVPDLVVQEDPALLMYLDNALMRTGE